MAIDWASVIKTVAPVATGMAGAMTANRGETDRLNIARDQSALQGARDASNAGIAGQELDLRRAQEARVAEDQAIRTALQSALMKNTKDASFDRSGFKSPVANISFNGGARPSALGEEGQHLASIMENRALQTLMAPTATASTSEAQPRNSGTYAAPTLSEPSKASFWEKALGPIGMGATVAEQLLPTLLKGGGAGGNAAAQGVASVASKMTGGASTAADVGSHYARDAVSDVAGKFGGGSSMLSAANSVAGPLAMGAGLVSGFLPEGKARTAADWASKGAQIGSFVPGVGTAIGAGVGAVAGAIKGHQNATVGDRKDFAKSLGYRDLDGLYQALTALGPEGQELTRQGLNVIGKHDKQGNAAWIQRVASLLGKRR